MEIKKAIITGANGTVGTALRARLAREGVTVIGWDRGRVPVDDYYAMEAFVREERPDALIHLAIATRPTGRPEESWLVNYTWTSELAWITRLLGVRFVFTSSVLVFTDHAPGPFTFASRPDAVEGYGHEKRKAEERVGYQNPEAVVARLGWQIGSAPGSNNMIDFLDRTMREQGQIRASRRWQPACSFLEDTAETLWKLTRAEPGLYALDSNKRWSFFEIATALNAAHGGAWNIVPVDDFVFDQRMLDPRDLMPPLDARLPGLASPHP